MRRQYLLGLSFVLVLFPGCREPSRAPTSEPTNSATLTPNATLEPRSNSNPTREAITLEIPYTKEKLSYGSYSITVERKRVKFEEYNAENEVGVLKKNGRVIRTFDAVRHPLGAFTRVALAPVLGDGHLQLVVEQTGARSWAYWVAALKPHFRIVFTNDYPVDHELRIEDRDGDSIPELLMILNTFWFFDGLCGACSPRFDIAFKYDQKRSVFQPATIS